MCRTFIAWSAFVTGIDCLTDLVKASWENDFFLFLLEYDAPFGGGAEKEAKKHVVLPV